LFLLYGLIAQDDCEELCRLTIHILTDIAAGSSSSHLLKAAVRITPLSKAITGQGDVGQLALLLSSL
jgi:hypothetical protein